MSRFRVFRRDPARHCSSMGIYFCAVHGRKHARGGPTELYLSHTLTHTSLCWYGEGAKCVGAMEGRIDRAAKECCKPWKKTKASCFPTVHHTRLAWELRRYHQHSLTHTENTCMQSLDSSRVIKKKIACTQEISISVSGSRHTLWLRVEWFYAALLQTAVHGGIHLYSLFMSYGAFAKLTLRLTLNAHSVCLSGFQTELLYVCVFYLMCNFLLLYSKP